jgi:hypothetical protein
MTKSVRAIKNPKQLVETKVRPKHDEDTYYRMYQKEKKERKRLQQIVGQIEHRIEKVNADNEEMFNELRLDAEYWKFSFYLATNQGVDFLNYEIDLIKKGLMQTEEEIKNSSNETD